ncbi:MAG TPA: hypothetical protein PLP49_10570, partial [Anaerohalosphaeraceae bacterium]|nr:hypothetical protein [Anaerohalosphaeraceae bacterium]
LDESFPCPILGTRSSALGITFYIGIKFQRPSIEIKNIQEIKELKIVTAFVRNRVSTGQEFYQLDDPTKIKEALLKCEKKPQSFTPTQNLVLIFYERLCPSRS